jgi:Protein of unknown function (DUF4235)
MDDAAERIVRARSDASKAKGAAMKAEKVIYKPIGIAGGIAAGAVAGMIFKRVWQLIEHDQTPPNPRDEDRDWVEVLLAATIQGAIFAAIKAAVDRGGATAVRRTFGAWPA